MSNPVYPHLTEEELTTLQESIKDNGYGVVPRVKHSPVPKIDLEEFSSRNGISARYAEKTLRSDFFGRVEIKL